MQTLYRTAQKFGVDKVFLFVLCFERSLLCSPNLHLFDQKYSKKNKFCEIYLCEYYFRESLSHDKIQVISTTWKKPFYSTQEWSAILIPWILGNPSINFWLHNK